MYREIVNYKVLTYPHYVPTFGFAAVRLTKGMEGDATEYLFARKMLWFLWCWYSTQLPVNGTSFDRDLVAKERLATIDAYIGNLDGYRTDFSIKLALEGLARKVKDSQGKDTWVVSAKAVIQTFCADYFKALKAWENELPRHPIESKDLYRVCYYERFVVDCVHEADEEKLETYRKNPAIGITGLARLSNVFRPYIDLDPSWYDYGGRIAFKTSPGSGFLFDNEGNRYCAAFYFRKDDEDDEDDEEPVETEEAMDDEPVETATAEDMEDY